jgi:hypothetical protein
MWFAGDVRTTGDSPAFDWREPIFKEVGDTRALVMLASEIDQFESGVFLAVPFELSSGIEGVVAETESPRGAIWKESKVEIRTFDTSYFELYTSDRNIRDTVLNQLGGSTE